MISPNSIEFRNNLQGSAVTHTPPEQPRARSNSVFEGRTGVVACCMANIQPAELDAGQKKIWSVVSCRMESPFSNFSISQRRTSGVHFEVAS